MKNSRRRKKPKPPKKVEEKKGVAEKQQGGGGERMDLEALVEAFSLSSLEEASMVAGADPDKTSEILRRGLVEDPCSSSSSSSSFSGSSSSGVSSGGLDLSSTSGSSEGSMEPICGEDLACFKAGKQKNKVVAATGTVSTVIGKEYLRRTSTRNKRFSNGVVDKEQAEQFLCSMLGNDCDLNLAVVRDVLCE